MKETAISLEPGQHTLKILPGGHPQIPHDFPLKSDSMTIHVE